MKDADFGNLGFYTLALHYGIWGLTAFMAAPIVNYLGCRLCLCLGGLSYCSYIAVFILPIEREEHPDNTRL